jgi:hypothetical protein
MKKHGKADSERKALTAGIDYSSEIKMGFSALRPESHVSKFRGDEDIPLGGAALIVLLLGSTKPTKDLDFAVTEAAHFAFINSIKTDELSHLFRFTVAYSSGYHRAPKSKRPFVLSCSLVSWCNGTSLYPPFPRAGVPIYILSRKQI